MYNIITIERQYASGGNEIGKRLAEALGYKLYDRNILMEAAKNLDIPFVKIEGLDESSSTSLWLILRGSGDTTPTLHQPPSPALALGWAPLFST